MTQNIQPKQPRSFIKTKNSNILEWPSQSSDLNPTEHAFHLLKAKQEWQSIKKEETQCLVMSMSSSFFFFFLTKY